MVVNKFAPQQVLLVSKAGGGWGQAVTESLPLHICDWCSSRALAAACIQAHRGKVLHV